MERQPAKGLDSSWISSSGIRKTFLSGMILIMIGIFSYCQKKNINSELPADEPVQETTVENHDDNMSAIRLTTLPFILAFRHLVADREE